MLLGSPVEVGGQSPVEGSQAHLVQTQGASEWVFPHGRDRGGPANHDPRLGSAQELVPGEAHEIRPLGQPRGHERLGGEPMATQIDQSPASQILNHVNPVGSTQPDEFGQSHFLHEASDFEIAAMNF